MKKILIGIILASSSITVWNQHCGLDYTSIIQIQIVGKDDVFIPNLKVILLDAKTEKPIISHKWYKEDITDTFRITPIKPYKQFYAVYEGGSLYPSTYPYFFGDNYAFQIVSGEQQQYADQFKIKIEDIDGYANGGSFKTKIVQLSNEYCYCMCTHYDSGRVKPFVVKLENK